VLSASVRGLVPYSSKTIARRVEGDANVVSLSIGEPEFGPPPSAIARLDEIAQSASMLADLKRYETSRGAPSLRCRRTTGAFSISTSTRIARSS
jgi:aspartate/methionine/tyrosine aminotransferase